MNKNLKGLLVVGGVAIIGYIVYKKLIYDPIKVVATHYYLRDSKTSYEDYLKSVKRYYNDNPDYVKNHAKAIKKKQPEFTFDGKTFLTSTGTLK